MNISKALLCTHLASLVVLLHMHWQTADFYKVPSFHAFVRIFCRAWPAALVGIAELIKGAKGVTPFFARNHLDGQIHIWACEVKRSTILSKPNEDDGGEPDIHHNCTLGTKLHFEQNYTLRSRTTLRAELHFEQNYTQNSN